MKLKYYLRGLGIGIIITTIVLMIVYSGHKTEMTDAEIIQKAEALGMVMKEEPLFSNSETNKETEIVEESEVITGSEMETEQENESVSESETQTETETVTETQTEIETEMESEIETEVETETESETQTEVETQTEAEIKPEPETESESEAPATRETYHLVIPSGSVPRLICNELEENGVVESAAALRQYLVEVGYVTSIVVGEYEIPYGATNEEIYQILKAGPIKR